MLTENEKKMVGQAAADLETGNHLLRPRSIEYRIFLNELCEALHKEGELTERERELVNAYNAHIFFNGVI